MHVSLQIIQSGALASIKGERAGAAKLVLMALAARARREDERWVCWPSVARIAEDTGIGQRSVYRALATLTDAGFIRAGSGGGRRANVYEIRVSAEGEHSTSDQSEPARGRSSTARRATTSEAHRLGRHVLRSCRPADQPGRAFDKPDSGTVTPVQVDRGALTTRSGVPCPSGHPEGEREGEENTTNQPGSLRRSVIEIESGGGGEPIGAAAEDPLRPATKTAEEAAQCERILAEAPEDRRLGASTRRRLAGLEHTTPELVRYAIVRSHERGVREPCGLIVRLLEHPDLETYREHIEQRRRREAMQQRAREAEEAKQREMSELRAERDRAQAEADLRLEEVIAAASHEDLEAAVEMGIEQGIRLPYLRTRTRAMPAADAARQPGVRSVVMQLLGNHMEVTYAGDQASTTHVR